MNHEVFLVPTDFTSIGDAALAHALKSAEKMNAHVCLFHVVEEKSEIQGAEDRLEKMAEEAMTSSDLTVNYVVGIGNIF